MDQTSCAAVHDAPDTLTPHFILRNGAGLSLDQVLIISSGFGAGMTMGLDNHRFSASQRLMAGLRRNL